MNRRVQFRQGLHDLFLPVYDQMCALLPDEWQPYFGYRSIEEQDALYAKGREDDGKIVTNAKGGESLHNYGMATDWTIFMQGIPCWTLPASEWVVYKTAINKAGGKWGGDWISFTDKPHAQINITVSGTQINAVRLASGMDAAIEYILDNCV